MTGDASFGSLLRRLVDRQQLDVGTLSQLAGLTDAELPIVFHGGMPSPSMLRRLAPVLGLHRADLFAIAGIGVPDDLASLDPRAERSVPNLVEYAVALPPQGRAALCQLVATLPQEQRTQPVPEPLVHEQYPASPGAVLMRMVRNRNLGWIATARTFLSVTGRYWSAATYGAVGHSRKRLTSEILADFCAVLDIPADDLAALTGVALPGGLPTPGPTAGLAELIWDSRRLTASQVQQVSDIAKSMRR